MRHLCVLMIAAVALVSCSGGGSSLPSRALPSTSAPTLTLPASNGAWSASLGPANHQNSGKFNAFVVDPQNTNVMYAGGGVGTVDGVTSDTGVFKTTNGGASWSSANTGLGDTTINWLSFDGRGALYAATEQGGIYRSTDGAGSWQQVSTAHAVRQLLYANGTLYATCDAGVLVSTDGSVWTLGIATSNAANALDVRGSDIFIGLSDGTVVRGTLGASPAVIGRFAALDAPPVVHAVAVDPADERSIYASMAGIVGNIYSDELMHSSDGGATWNTVSIPPTLRGAQAIAFSTTVAHRLYIAGVGLAYTDDGHTLTTASGYGDARTLHVLAGDRLVIGSDQGLSTGSFGTSFTPLTAGLAVNIVRSVAFHGATMLVTMQDFPPALTTDGGSTWQTLNLDSNENGVAYINPSNPSLCYVLDNDLSVSSDGCRTFAPQTLGRRLSSTEPFATDSSSPKTYLLTSNGFYVANDGVHFLAIACGVPYPVDLAVDPHNANHVYLSTATGGVAVWRSLDGGVTFTRSASLMPPGPSYPNDAPVLAVDPSNGDIIAVTETAVYRSTDGGATFPAVTQLAAQSKRRDPDARSEAVATAGYNIDEHAGFVATPNGPMLVITTTAGIVASFDDGTTLHPLAANAISHQFEGFSVDSNGTFCAGTDGEGVVCSSTSALANLR